MDCIVNALVSKIICFAQRIANKGNFLNESNFPSTGFMIVGTVIFQVILIGLKRLTDLPSLTNVSEFFLSYSQNSIPCISLLHYEHVIIKQYVLIERFVIFFLDEDLKFEFDVFSNK